jgi:hypothetical protein
LAHPVQPGTRCDGRCIGCYTVAVCPALLSDLEDTGSRLRRLRAGTISSVLAEKEHTAAGCSHTSVKLWSKPSQTLATSKQQPLTLWPSSAD